MASIDSPNAKIFKSLRKLSLTGTLFGGSNSNSDKNGEYDRGDSDDDNNNNIEESKSNNSTGKKTNKKDKGAVNRSPVTCSGYLYKMKRTTALVSLSDWNKRFFTIEGELLQWYKNGDSAKPSGFVRIASITKISLFKNPKAKANGRNENENVKDVIPPNTTFMIKSSSRTLFLRSSTASDCSRWLNLLQLQLDLVNGGTFSGPKSKKNVRKSNGGGSKFDMMGKQLEETMRVLEELEERNTITERDFENMVDEEDEDEDGASAGGERETFDDDDNDNDSYSRSNSSSFSHSNSNSRPSSSNQSQPPFDSAGSTTPPPLTATLSWGGRLNFSETDEFGNKSFDQSTLESTERALNLNFKHSPYGKGERRSSASGGGGFDGYSDIANANANANEKQRQQRQRGDSHSSRSSDRRNRERYGDNGGRDDDDRDDRDNHNHTYHHNYNNNNNDNNNDRDREHERNSYRDPERTSASTRNSNPNPERRSSNPNRKQQPPLPTEPYKRRSSRTDRNGSRSGNSNGNSNSNNSSNSNGDHDGSSNGYNRNYEQQAVNRNNSATATEREEAARASEGQAQDSGRTHNCIGSGGKDFVSPIETGRRRDSCKGNSGGDNGSGDDDGEYIPNSNSNNSNSSRTNTASHRAFERNTSLVLEEFNDEDELESMTRDSIRRRNQR